MPDLQPLPADEPFIQFNIPTTTDRKQQVVSFPIPQNYRSLGCMLNQVHVPHSISQRPRKWFYLFPRTKPTAVAKSWIRSFLCTTRISYSTRWSERDRDRHELWCGTKVSVVRCHRRRKYLTTSLPRTIQCTILFNRLPHLAVSRSFRQIGYFVKYSVTSKIISNIIYRS